MKEIYKYWQYQINVKSLILYVYLTCWVFIYLPSLSSINFVNKLATFKRILCDNTPYNFVTTDNYITVNNENNLCFSIFY